MHPMHPMHPYRNLRGGTNTLPNSNPAINATSALNTATPVSSPNE